MYASFVKPFPPNYCNDYLYDMFITFTQIIATQHFKKEFCFGYLCDIIIETDYVEQRATSMQSMENALREITCSQRFDLSYV